MSKIHLRNEYWLFEMCLKNCRNIVVKQFYLSFSEYKNIYAIAGMSFQHI